MFVRKIVEFRIVVWSTKLIFLVFSFFSFGVFNKKKIDFCFSCARLSINFVCRIELEVGKICMKWNYLNCKIKFEMNFETGGGER